MIKIVKKAIILLLPLASLTTLAHGQDIPAVTAPVSSQGFQLPDTFGTLRYALSGSESARSGYFGGGGEVWSTDLSGDLAYLSASDVHPFSMVYSGGYLHTTTSNRPSSVFQNLLLSQVLNTRLWNFLIADSVSYLPESPVTGLSGIPGLGDVGVGSTPSDTGLDILSGYAQRVSNTSSGSVSRQLTGSTGIQGSGSYTLMRFVDDTANRFSTNQMSGTGGVNHRIDALNSARVGYTYSEFTYPNDNFTFITQGINLGYERRWNRRLTINLSAGPQRTIAPNGGTGVPSYNLATNMTLNYVLEHGTTNLSYVRGVQSGSGVVQGTISDSVSFGANRELGRLWHGGLEANYARHSSVKAITSNPFSVDSIIASIQLSRTLTESLSTYASYSAQSQSSSGTPFSGFSGLSQVVAFGVTYSPRTIRLGH